MSLFSIVFFTLLTASVMVTGYFGVRYRLLKKYSNEYTHLMVYTDDQKYWFIISGIITALLIVAGIILL